MCFIRNGSRRVGWGAVKSSALTVGFVGLELQPAVTVTSNVGFTGTLGGRSVLRQRAYPHSHYQPDRRFKTRFIFFSGIL